MTEPRPDPARRRMRRREEVFRWAFLAPAIAFLLLYFGYPIVKNLMMSVQDYTTRTFYTGESPFVGLANYAAVVKSSVFSTALINTVLFTVGSITGQFTIGLALAVFFKKHFPLNGVMRSLMLLPWLLPMIVSSAIWKWMLDKDSGVVNQLLGLAGVENIPWLTSTEVALIAVVMVNIWLGIPFNMTILYSGLQDIPDELYEAAALDGATGWRAFRNITWPLLRPVVSVVLILGVVYTLKVLDIILGLTEGGPSNATETLATQSYRLSFANFEFGQGAALGNILVLISLVFAMVYLRMTRSGTED
ncbi:carbohydrate ABC transporter membrane protein 1, CUT1 family [Actinomyces ruminicola]|uniref:Carbohydrate ABC transporter membrane protein 1, CUT1 family n=1 Tax=Actinomyces ruminicola TaxID=332524 RepID=A0A1H0BG87_9ACTO|nr:sugar ABC transporter permease [Actinomyces ruminicola]SDN44640.1 carbohydrate ABC transporter membrane protein 1, CUT1 family [Actinomyces ruminicola]